MAKFLDTLTAEQKSNVLGLIESMKKNGITNTMIQAGILAVISKESTFVPKSEKDYSGTDNDRIRAIFGTRVKKLTDAELTKLKKDPKAFFDLIYGDRYENGPDEGYKYRGRGFNQLTFKSNYRKTSERIGIDLVAKPDRLNEVPVATEAVISFFKEKFAAAPKSKLELHDMTDINSAKTVEDAVNAAYHANTGWGKTKEQIVNEKTGGYKKAIDRVGEFYQLTSGKISLSGAAKPTDSKPAKPADAKPAKPADTKPAKPSANANVKSYAIVIAQNLNVRTEPSVNSVKANRPAAVAGEVLPIFDEQSGWYKISSGENHWIAAKYCVVARKGIVDADVLNVRSAAIINAEKTGELKRGSVVYITQVKSGWGKLGLDQKWISLQYVKF
jgi:predicted chitinase